MRTLEWRSLGGAEYRLEIQDGMDEVRGLVGGASPFVTSTDDDDDFFAAVRTTTGAISVIGDVAEVEELVTGVPADKMVELYAKKSDGTDLGCVWRGFLQTTAYSQAWNKGPLQFSLPVVSPLGVLDSFYPKADVVEKTWSFAEFLVNANKAKEGMLFWDGFVFPASCNPEQTLMYRMQMQNFGTYDEKQERWHVESYMMILQEVCKLFGWACQEWNNKLVFLTADDTTEYLGYRADRLEQKITTGVAIVENIRVETTAETIWGAEHQLDYIDGKKSVEVTGEVNVYEGTNLWSINFNELEVNKYGYATIHSDNPLSDDTDKYFCVIFNPGKRIEMQSQPGNIKLDAWLNRSDVNGTSIVRDRQQFVSTPLANETWQLYSDTGWNDRMLYRAKDFDNNIVLFTIATDANVIASKLLQNVSLLLSGQIKRSDSYKEEFESFTGFTGLAVDMYIGDKLAKTKTLEVVDGAICETSASGAVVAISEESKGILFFCNNNSGPVTLKFRTWTPTSYYYSIEGLSLNLFLNWSANSDYYNPIPQNKSKKTNDEKGYKGEVSVKTNMTTAVGGQAGYGIVLANDVMAEPPVSLNVSGERPEVHLADRLWNYYKQSRKKLTVQLRMDGEGLNPLNLHSFSEAVPLSTGNNSEAVPLSTGKPLSTEIRGMACLAQTIDWAEDMVTAALFET